MHIEYIKEQNLLMCLMSGKEFIQNQYQEKIHEHLDRLNLKYESMTFTHSRETDEYCLPKKTTIHVKLITNENNS